jgi:hypothetical protein
MPMRIPPEFSPVHPHNHPPSIGGFYDSPLLAFNVEPITDPWKSFQALEHDRLDEVAASPDLSAA